MGNRGQLLTGVKSLPLLVLDDNDRNRTSPFAFTGNKFEFRMVGSSQSIGFVNAVLDAAVADKLEVLAQKLEGAANLDAVVAEIVHDTWNEHSKVIYNGNNYSEEWLEEATRRGLPNHVTMVEAAKAFINPKNVEMFERTKVFKPSECTSRYEVMLDSYAKTMRIATATLLEMAKRSVLPAACAYLSDTAQTVAHLKKAGTRCGYVDGLTDKLAAAVDDCSGAGDRMAAALEQVDLETGAEESAIKMRSLVENEMCELRKCCDELEPLVPEDCWPMPGYSALLYDV